jgi:hypothetical protein
VNGGNEAVLNKVLEKYPPTVWKRGTSENYHFSYGKLFVAVVDLVGKHS